MSLILPSRDYAAASGGSNRRLLEHKPFPDDMPTFYRVEEEVTVMRSLQAPKKVTFVGSDGAKYSFLCKPKDDLRRDCRLQDFNELLNKLFMQDAECRKRDLRIRTYVRILLSS